jgi:hypothetical protein
MNGEIMSLGVLQQSSVPPNPKTGYDLVYTKSDGLYTLTSTGTETKIGPGAVDIAATVHAATDKTAIVDNDEFALVDSETTYTLKKTLWTDIKSVLKTYFDGIYTTGSGYITADGDTPLTDNWDAGGYKITANQLESDVAAGTAPLVVASDTVVSNLNADLLDGNHAAAFQAAGSYAAATHYHAGTDITSSTIDGDRLPAISTTKQGAVPATGTPAGKYLKDDGNWSALTGGGDVTGPSSSTSGNITTFNGATGKVIQDSGHAMVTACTASQVPVLDSSGHIDNQMLKIYQANRIENNGAEIDTTGWATYADAAGTTPVDGTGGSPTCTWTRTTTTPLSGAGSFLFTKDGVNRQGEGASYDFTIGTGEKGMYLNIRFIYTVTSGTGSYASNDMIVYIYDVTNGALIQPDNYAYKIKTTVTNVSQELTCSFKAATNSTSYRLIFHVSSTSTNAYTVKFDNITVRLPDWQPVFAHYKNTASTPLAYNVATKIPWATKIEDTHSAMNTTTGDYTIPYSGVYQVNCTLGTTGGYGVYYITLFLNTTEVMRGNRENSSGYIGAVLAVARRFEAGDVIYVGYYTSGTNLETVDQANHIEITRLSP